MAKLHTFILNDESINVYGFRVLTAGINLEGFRTNPIMLYDHIRGYERSSGDPLLPIGRWVNIRVEGTQLLADADFDMEDDFAVKVSKKVDKGVLNTASIHLDIIELSEDPSLMLPGQMLPTIVKSIAKEGSIADIPGNSKCLKLQYNGRAVKLNGREDNTDELQKLFLSNKPDSSMKSLVIFLNTLVGITLNEDAKEGEVLSAIKKLSDQHREQLSLKDQKITELAGQVDTYKQAAQAAELKAIDDKAIALVDAAISSGKIVAGQKDQYVKLAKADYDSTKTILDALKAYQSVSQRLIDNGGDTTADADKVKKYDELFKSGKLADLKRNDFEQYKELFKAKYGKEPK